MRARTIRPVRSTAVTRRVADPTGTDRTAPGTAAARTALSRRALRRSAIAVTATASALSLTACGMLGGGEDSGGAKTPAKGNNITVGILMSDLKVKRWERFDYPLIKEGIMTLTEGKGKVKYANAEGDTKKQAAQVEDMIDQKVDVLIVGAVDAKAIKGAVQKAKSAGVPIIAYDRLAQGPIEAYVSHDNELVGEVQGRSLVEELGTKASSSRIIMMNGAPDDPNTALFKTGALDELQDKVVITKTYDTYKWDPVRAKANMKKAIQSVGMGNIAAVYSANDGIAGAAIEAMKEAGASEMPPVTGQDAELAAIQRIVAGEQFMTVYKPFVTEAKNAAEVAVAMVQGRSIEFDALTRDKVDSPTTKDIPSNLVPVVAITQQNIKETVIRDGVYSVKEICTPKYAEACAKIGLK